MYTVLVVIQVIISIALIAFVLLQQGKGADAGAAFGAGASGTVFGSRGSANFFSRATAVCAALFMGISLALAYLVQDAARVEGGSVVDSVEVPAADGASGTGSASGNTPPRPTIPE